PDARGHDVEILPVEDVLGDVVVGLEKASVIPFFVDADYTPNPAGLPIGGVTQVDLPNDHLQYDFTWYGLAAVLVVVVAISWFR
ncbi:SURF1 family cytochrome oxidase biogenesis protein, partial [Rhizobium ruizarguesonis]